jgi:hypothetical protein
MLERVLGFSLARFALVVSVLLAALAGCNRAETSIYGYVDVVPSGLRESACGEPIPGHLQLDGMQVADVVTVSADELCHNWIVRKEVPAGLYTVSWQASDDDTANGARWEAHGAGIVNVFPEQTTTVRVLRVETDPELLTRAMPEELPVDRSRW